jgi:glutamate--cysteine ligase
VSEHWQQQLQQLAESDPTLLCGIGRGIEKESLRVSPDGTLAQTAHPRGLGSALTHSSITTDYSEALLEFITPVARSVDATLDTLEDIHSFVYRHLGDELLWSNSMPCIVAGDAGIPVARYGSSNVGRMKTVYRYGLGHRYGRLMQAIAGVHYNFSMPQRYWELSYAADGARGALQDYISGRYLGLIRNFHRWSWLLIYLFGASPAVCASFMRGRRDHPLQNFDSDGSSLYLPHATSLRMGGLGYNSDAQASLHVCYNSLDSYLQTLARGILEPYPAYEAFRGLKDGEYQQLNDGLLQIENEFYSPIRPKRPAQSGETPLTALRERGIEYVEVRCIDVSPFHPLGVDRAQLRFVDAFLLLCLLSPSPECDEAEQHRRAVNLEAVVNRGREPGLCLKDGDQRRPLAEWATELLERMRDSAQLLDDARGGHEYRTAVDNQRTVAVEPEQTPSARVLREMREEGLPFFRFGLRYSRRWAEYFATRSLDPATLQAFEEETARSLAEQAALEATEEPSFEDYLAGYYAQYEALL